MKMKKLTALVTLVVFMFSCFATAFADTTETGTAFADVTSETQYSEAIQKLYEDGIVDGYLDANGVRTYKPNDTITRGEFTKLLVATMLKKVPTTLTATSCGFSDVDTDPTVSWTIPYVEYAVKASIVNGYEDGTFRANNTVTFAEAVKMIVCAMGYANVIEKTEPWYNGYLKVAQQIGILNGAYTDAEAPASRGLVAQLIYNMNTSDKHITTLPGGSGNSSGPNINFNDDEKTEIAIGMITKVFDRGVDGAAALKNNQIAIDNIVYTVNKNQIEGLYAKLGYYAEVEYVIDGSENVIKNISYVGYNNTIEIKAGDIQKVSETQLEYSTANSSKNSVIKYSSGLRIIHNGVGVPAVNGTLIKSLLNVTDGSILFVDGNDDRTMDTAYVTSYDTYFVGSYGDDSDKRITDKYFTSNTYVFTEEPENIQYKTNTGAAAAYGSIRENSIVAIAKPYNATTQYGITNVIITNNNTKTGSISGQSGDVYTVGSTEIEASNYYLDLVGIEPSQAVSAGDSATFYLDHENKLVAVSVSDTNKYGYLVTVNDIDKKNITLEMVSSTSSAVEDDYTLSDTVNVNGVDTDAKDVPAKLLASANAINTGKDSSLIDNASYSQPIIFKTKSNGKVIKAITTVNAGADSSYLEYTLGKVTGNTKYKYFSGNVFKQGTDVKFNMSFVSQNTSDVATKVFVVPKDRDEYTEYISIDTVSEASEFFISQKEYNVEAFNVNSITKKAEIVVVYGGTEPEVKYSDSAVIVDSIKHVTNSNDDPAREIYYYKLGSEGGKLKSVVTDESINSQADTLEKGDIIKFATKAGSGLATLIEKVLVDDTLYKQDQTAITTAPLKFTHTYPGYGYYNAYRGIVYSFDTSNLYLIPALTGVDDSNADAYPDKEYFTVNSSTTLYVVDLTTTGLADSERIKYYTDVAPSIKYITNGGVANASKVFVSKLGDSSTSNLNAIVIFK